MVVRGGLEWPHPRLPSTKEMLGRLERNEAYISWLMPKGGVVDDQFPAMRIQGVYYTISLRMMKAVWRHVRLKKGFVNRELVPHIGLKLRIPAVLLSEKIRTQQRFNVLDDCVCGLRKLRARAYVHASASCINTLDTGRSCAAARPSRGTRSPARATTRTCSPSCRT